MLILLPISYKPYVCIMKTTLEIADPLLRDARKVAAQRARRFAPSSNKSCGVFSAKKSQGRDFRLRKASFKGRGLRP